MPSCDAVAALAAGRLLARAARRSRRCAAPRRARCSYSPLSYDAPVRVVTGNSSGCRKLRRRSSAGSMSSSSRGHVHDALEHRRRLGPPGPAERAHRRRVRQHGGAVVGDGGDAVDALRHLARRPEGQRAAEPGVRAGVADDPHAQADDRAVAAQPELAVLHLPAAVRHRHEVLRAGLDPLHRAPELPRRLDRPPRAPARARPCRRSRRRRAGRRRARARGPIPIGVRPARAAVRHLGRDVDRASRDRRRRAPP